MSLIRRSLAAFSGLLLLQLTLLGSGTFCAIRHDIARNAAVTHGMDGMTGMAEMSAIDVVGASRVAAAEAVPSGSDDCAGLRSHDGCGSPWAPGQCSSMTACDSLVAAPASAGSSLATRAVGIGLPSPTLVELGPTFAPELPPPRA